MNKLDYLDMSLDGEGNLSELFKCMGSKAMAEEVSTPIGGVSDVELKATTVRLPVPLLHSYDAVLKHFGLTRQDTFAYMVHDFIANSVTSYVDGQVKYIIDNNIAYDDCDNLYQLYFNILDDILESIEGSDEVKASVKSICHTQAIKNVRGYDVTNNG